MSESEPAGRLAAAPSPAALASPLEDDDLLREILLRLPPQPSSLPRASAVCKRWLGLVTDPRFLPLFSAHHRDPPLLGFFQNSQEGYVFTPILDPPDRIPPERFGLGSCSGRANVDVASCRHGRLLVEDWERRVLVLCNPITAELSPVAFPPEFYWGSMYGAVLRDAGSDQGHLHGGCHSTAFKLVLLSLDRKRDRPFVRVYSSRTGIWGNAISTAAPSSIFCVPAPETLVGNALYWLSTENNIVEFDFHEHRLTVVTGPPVSYGFRNINHQIIRAEDGALASPYFLTHGSKCGGGMSIVRVLPHGCRGRPLKWIAFLDSLLGLKERWEGRLFGDMMRIPTLYFYVSTTVCTWFNSSPCNLGSLMEPLISWVAIIHSRASIHQVKEVANASMAGSVDMLSELAYLACMCLAKFRMTLDASGYLNHGISASSSNI